MAGGPCGPLLVRPQCGWTLPEKAGWQGHPASGPAPRVYLGFYLKRHFHVCLSTWHSNRSKKYEEKENWEESHDRKHKYCRSYIALYSLYLCTRRSRHSRWNLHSLCRLPLRSWKMQEVTILKPFDHTYSTLKSLSEKRRRVKIEHDDKIERE